MSKHLYLGLVAVMLLAMTSSCKKMGALSPNYFTTTPEVLEVVGTQVPVTINGKFPEKYFLKKAIVTVTPVLSYEGGETTGEPAVFQGEKVKGNNKTIAYKAGGLFTMKASFPYKEAMRKSQLFLDFSVKVKKKQYVIPRVKIADGVISTATLATAAASTPAIAPDKFQRIIKEAQQANILFLINRAELRASELKGKSVTDLKERLDQASKAANQNVTGMEVSAYASPDGKMDFNEQLSQKREKVSSDFMSKELKGANVNAQINGKFTAEDWEGFKELVEKSNLQDKEIVLRVLSMYSDPEEREREIKKISVAFKEIAEDILPQLRRSKMTLSIDIIGKSDEEIVSLAKSNPSALNIEESLYAATLVNTNAEKLAIYKKTAELFPTDFRAVNNIGVILFQDGKFDEAASQFDKASKINNSPEVNMNKALISLVNGKTAEAQVFLGKASAAPEYDETMGLLYIMTGEYSKAATSFAKVKTNNAAVAYILVKDYNKAKSVLSEIKTPSATTNYISAIVGARTNNQAMVIDGLKAAIAKDGKFAKMAATDLEFAKFATNADFVNIVK